MQTLLMSRQTFVIRPSGYLNASNAIEFQHQITTVVTQECYSNVLVDLEHVESLDSAGLMALIYSLRLAHALDRRFSICSASPSIKIIFELTQLDQVFDLFESFVAFEAAIA
jgi:anti-anti-sigma factor